MKIPFQNLFKKKDASDAPVPQPEQSAGNKGVSNFLSKFKLKFGSGLKSRLGKKSIQGEEIVGVELCPGEIRLSQVSNNKSNQWVLDKFYVHKIEGLPEGSTALENPDKYGDELQIALQKSMKSVVLAGKPPLPPGQPPSVRPSARPSVHPGRGRPNLYT